MPAKQSNAAGVPFENAVTTPQPHSDLWARLPRPLTGSGVPITALLLTFVATLAGMLLSRAIPQQSISLVYLIAVVLAAVALGIRTGLAVALLSFFAYNFFFIPPIFTFTIADPEEVFALFVFLIVALLTGSLAGRMREVADDARRHAAALQSLNDFAAMLSGLRGASKILDVLAKQAAATVHGEAIVLMRNGEHLETRAFGPRQPVLGSADLQAAHQACRSGDVVHASAPGWPGARMDFYPIVATTGSLGVVGVASSIVRRVLTNEDVVSLQTMVRHAAIAVERTQLESDAAQAREEIERERLRSALLSSLSHDLRTPLATILGSVTSLRELGSQLPSETQADLLAAIEEEARRLTRFVTNLLDMTRLETMNIDILHDWIDVGDIVRTAVTRAARIAPDNNPITLACPPALPAIKGDTTLLEHVVFNLLDNAIKFSNAGQRVDVVVSAAKGMVSVSIADTGRGIPVEAMSRIFEPFYRVKEGDGDVPGTGLGLAICRRVIKGMNGSIDVKSPIVDGRGTSVTIAFPVPIPDAEISAVCREQGA